MREREVGKEGGGERERKEREREEGREKGREERKIKRRREKGRKRKEERVIVSSRGWSVSS